MITVVGVDLAKHSFAVARARGPEGPTKDPVEEFRNTPSGCQSFLKSLEDPQQTYVVFEATGFYGKLLLRQLDGKVAGLFEINPRLVKRFSTSMVQTKTDSADAVSIANVAQMLLESKPDELQKYRRSFDEDLENLAVWVAEYRRLSRAAAKLKTQIESLSAHVCPEVEEIQKLRIAELDILEQSKKRAKKLIEQRMATRKAGLDAELLESIPGIGPLSAAALVVAIRTIHRFDSADSLKAYLGLYPRRRQTGRREAPSRMAKHGNALVRHMIWNASRSAARFNPVCKQVFEKLQAKGKSGPQAYGAVARKLIQICYGVLLNRAPFSPGVS